MNEALCYGLIDGIRKSVDELSYANRISTRRKGSTWSPINIKRAQELIEKGLMQPPGLQAFSARKEYKSGIYSYEQRSERLDKPYEERFRKNKKAWEFFQAQTPSYRKTVNWWVVSAKKEETRLKRLDELIERSAQGEKIPGV